MAAAEKRDDGMDWILNRYQGRPAGILAQVRRCGEEDLPAFCRLQADVRAGMPDPELFLPDTEEELRGLLQRDLCLGVWVNGTLGAFLILRYCKEDGHNYANALGVPKSDWKYWANADSAAVRPDLRGNGLQRRLLALAEQWRDPAIVGIGATVSPANPYSLKNAMTCGFTIAKRCEMYGGHDRYLLQKRLLPLPGKYRHFKGRPYQVLTTAVHSETREELVIYRALYGEYDVWARPAAMWFEHVDRDTYHGPRFVWAE